jgi:cell division transport system permease protein
MSLSYTLRESVSGFTRTKLSSAVSILTICISLLLLGVFGILSINASRFIDALRDKVELEAFLEEPLSDEEISTLQAAVASIDGVEEVRFVSKDEAARIFKEEFGEDITTVLDFNPLPPSFKIRLDPESRTAAEAQRINDRLLTITGISEVVYRKGLIELIDRRTEAVNSLTLGLGILVSLSAIVLVSNTIRLAIHAKRRIIETMSLVGATSTFIRLPFLLEGIIQGFLGGLLAAGILYLAFDRAIPFLSPELGAFLGIEPIFYAAVAVAGTALGLFGSAISVTRFIRPSGAA